MSHRIPVVVDDMTAAQLDRLVEHIGLHHLKTTRSAVIRKCLEYGLRNPAEVGLPTLSTLAGAPSSVPQDHGAPYPTPTALSVFSTPPSAPAKALGGMFATEAKPLALAERTPQLGVQGFENPHGITPVKKGAATWLQLGLLAKTLGINPDNVIERIDPDDDDLIDINGVECVDKVGIRHALSLAREQGTNTRDFERWLKDNGIYL